MVTVGKKVARRNLTHENFSYVELGAVSEVQCSGGQKTFTF